jgi:hypothetical protein
LRELRRGGRKDDEDGWAFCACLGFEFVLGFQDLGRGRGEKYWAVGFMALLLGEGQDSSNSFLTI